VLRRLGARRRGPPLRTRDRHVQVRLGATRFGRRATHRRRHPMTVNRQILLVSRPKGEPGAENFRLVETPLPALAEGEVLVRHHFLSLDPYMRGRMSDAKSYAPPQPLDQVMLGGTAGEVVESRHPRFTAGDR